MSPLNSNSKYFSLYNKSKQCYNHSSKCSVIFSSFFNLCIVYLKKNVLSFFFFFSYAVFNNVQVSLLFFFLFFSVFLFHPHCPVAFCFCFCFHFFFIINCSFNVPCFSNLISTSLCPYLNTITRGSLPSNIPLLSIVP